MNEIQVENNSIPSFVNWTNAENLVIRSLSLNKEQLKKLFDILSKQAKSASEKEVEQINKIQQVDQTVKQSILNTLQKQENGTLRIQIFSAKGLLTTDDKNITDKDVFPENIYKIIIDNNEVFSMITKTLIHNTFRMEINFKPWPCAYNVKNESYCYVAGNDATWVNGTFKLIDDFLDDKQNSKAWLQTQWTHNLLFIIIGIPVCFRFTYLIEKFTTTYLSKYSFFLQFSIAIYIFVVLVMGFNKLLIYTQSIFPNVEYLEDKKPKNELFWWLVGIALLLISDYIKMYVSKLFVFFFSG